MEALLQQLSDWLKGMLVDGIMNNLSGMFLTFIACYELIQLIIEHNNLANFETWIFFKWRKRHTPSTGNCGMKPRNCRLPCEILRLSMKQNCRNSKRSKKKRHIEATRVGYHGFVLWYPTPFLFQKK